MNLFFKHMLRSIRGRPIQPIILVLTLSLSLAVSSVILSIKSAIFNETMSEFSEKYGSSDIIISVDTNSTSRVIFASEVERIVPEGAKVSGYYELLLSGGEDIILGAATDFKTVGNVFDLSFTEYGKITEDNLASCAIVDSDFARLEDIFDASRVTFPSLARDFTELSIGMSDDYPLAIEYGSTMIRVGSMIFGERNY